MKSFHSKFEAHLQALVRIEDDILGGLSVEDAKWWPKTFAEAVPVGKDLSLVVPKFMVYLLESVLQYTKEDGRKPIQKVIDLYNRKILGEVVELAEWREARATAAYDAVSSYVVVAASSYAYANASYAYANAAVHAAHAAASYASFATKV